MELPRDILSLEDWTSLPETSEHHVEVVEVLSEGTRRTDQVTKFSGVAELDFAGTPLTLDLNALTTRRAQRP
ncbi:hypothetical protein [Amycolatopsis sp. NPDC049159]|uniref:hypothetical protein n=1 Tax=Amycolatopsis sp. NPDC049159 TaxID=3157210 RepID=UPI0033C33CCE